MMGENATAVPVGFINRDALADPGWWHWLLTVPLLAAHLAGVTWAIAIAIGLCVVASVYFFVRIGRLQPYPVQVRLAYLGLLVSGMLPSMFWIHWVQLIGTTAMVSAGYCPLIRMLALLPFNRKEPLTWGYLGRVLFRDPCVGGFVRWSDATTASSPTCCSLDNCRVVHEVIKQT